MPTAAFNITPAWTKAADGPINALIPAKRRFSWAITTGAAPTVTREICDSIEEGDRLSMTLAAGESLYVAADNSLATTVTTGA